MLACSNRVILRAESVGPPGDRKILSPAVFAISCVVAGLVIVILAERGGIALATCVPIGAAFSVVALIRVRAALLFSFGFSLVQPVVTRILFFFDFPNAAPESMLDYNDPLTTMASLLLICSTAVALLYHIDRGRAPLSSGLLCLIGFYACVNFVQIMNPNNTVVTGIYGFKNNVLPVLMVLVGAAAVQSQQDLARVVKFVAFFSAGALCYGLYQEIAGMPAFEDFWFTRTFSPGNSMYLPLAGRIEVRIPSVFQMFTSYSYVITGFGIIIYAVGERFTRGVWKLLRIACLVLLMLYFAFSMERIAIAMFLSGAITFHFVASRSKKRTFRFIVLGAAGCALLSYGLSQATELLKEKGFATASLKLVRLSEMANPFGAQTVSSSRREYWTDTFKTIASAPIVGAGVGRATTTRGLGTSGLKTLPHNEYFHKQVELGVFGLLAFLALLCGACLALYRQASDPDNTDGTRSFAAAAIGMLAAFAVCGLVNVPFLYESGIVLWFVIGLALARENETPQERESATQSIQPACGNAA